MNLVASAAAGVAAFVTVAVAFAGGYALHEPVQDRTPSPAVTVTRTAPPKAITRTVPSKTITATVTASPPDSSALTADNECLADLFQMIEGWITLTGSTVANYGGGTATVPSGWWDGPPCPPDG